MILEGGEVQERYFRQLNNKREPVEIIIRKAREGYVVLLYGAKDDEHKMP